MVYDMICYKFIYECVEYGYQFFPGMCSHWKVELDESSIALIFAACRLKQLRATNRIGIIWRRRAFVSDDIDEGQDMNHQILWWIRLLEWTPRRLGWNKPVITFESDRSKRSSCSLLLRTTLLHIKSIYCIYLLQVYVTKSKVNTTWTKSRWFRSSDDVPNGNSYLCFLLIGRNAHDTSNNVHRRIEGHGISNRDRGQRRLLSGLISGGLLPFLFRVQQYRIQASLKPLGLLALRQQILTHSVSSSPVVHIVFHNDETEEIARIHTVTNRLCGNIVALRPSI